MMERDAEIKGNACRIDQFRGKKLVRTLPEFGAIRLVFGDGIALMECTLGGNPTGDDE